MADSSLGRSRRPLRALILGLCLASAVAFAPAGANAATPSEVQAALRSQRISDVGVRDFYRARGHAPLWVQGNALGREADALLHLLSTAQADGLRARDYRLNALEEAVEDAREGRARALAKAEILLSRRFAQYVRDMRRVQGDAIIYADPRLRPQQPTARQALDAAAAAPSLVTYIETVGWMHPIYARLRTALAEPVRSLLQIPPGPMLRLGSTGDRVRLLRQRFGLPAEGEFDAALASAVRDFQLSQDLDDDAIVGRLTLAALNGSGHGVFSRQEEQVVRLNLERARALPGDPPRRYVLVDTAGARLWTYENGQVRDTMSVVVGRATDPTPMIAGMIQHATLNPYWNVPSDLAAERIAPRVVAEGMGYLRAKGYEVLSDWGERASVLNPREINWADVAAGRRQVRVRQRPGPENAMGRMKFMFPNELGVYLHDTPQRDLLREAARQFSAGCVRIEDASRLARWMFGRTLTAEGREPEQDVRLPEPVPVYITYLTAAPEGDRIAFRPDVYNRDNTQMARR